MPAITEVDVVQRVRSVCEGLGFTEAAGLEFERQPSTNADGTFLVRYASSTPTGGMAFAEEARGIVTVSMLRFAREQYPTAVEQLLTDARSVLSGIVRDGAIVSGQYAVEDGGQAFRVEAPRGASYLIGRLSVPVNFEAQL